MSAEQKKEKGQALKSCAKCARDGVGAAVLSHAGCIVAPIVAGAFGASISGAFMAAAMYVTSPLIAVGATYGLDRMRGQKPSIKKMFGSAAIALVVAYGINSVLGHDHGDHGDHNNHHHQQHQHQHHEHHSAAETQRWFETQDAETRRQIAIDAQRMQMSVMEYAAQFCGGPA